MSDRILVVEDDDTVRRLLRMLLEDEHYQVVEAATGQMAIERFDNSIDLVLLDVRLPMLSGFDVCRRIRKQSNVPVIMVTAQHDSHDVVTGLELGADDYVTKPFNDRELLARIRVQLRRRETDIPSERMSVGPIMVSPAEGVATRDTDVLALTRTEFRLLCHFVTNPNRVWSRDQLLQEIWGYEYSGDSRLVDTHIARLRAKIEVDPSNPELLLTVRGLGYKMVNEQR